MKFIIAIKAFLIQQNPRKSLMLLRGLNLLKFKSCPALP